MATGSEQPVRRRQTVVAVPIGEENEDLDCLGRNREWLRSRRRNHRRGYHSGYFDIALERKSFDYDMFPRVLYLDVDDSLVIRMFTDDDTEGLVEPLRRQERWCIHTRARPVTHSPVEAALKPT